MNPPSNIECFEYAAAGVLARLYEVFPRPLPIVSKEMEAQLSKGGMIPETCVWPPSDGNPTQTLVGSTITWLSEEGLVRFESGSGGRFKGVVLTAKGFSALQSPIVATESEDMKAGKALLEMVRDGVRTGVAGIVAGVISGITR